MISETTKAFRHRLASLPPQIRAYAKRVYQRWQLNPRHPSLQFKPIHPSLPIYSVRIGLHWRAIGIVQNDKIIWFWIGSHKEYDQKISALRQQS